MNKTELKEIILDQNKQKPGQILIERDIFKLLETYIKNPFIIVISGIRRSGKSTLLSQIKSKYPGYYLNFDDERLIHFSLEDFQVLYETFIEIYGENNIFYFDEIQNIPGWERFVRRLHDERKKVFVSGSNASMLSRELGTRLTGRHLEASIFPFSFKEFLKQKNFQINKDTAYITASKAMLKKYFDEYLVDGGFPEYLREKNKDYLKALYENILYRDIIVRYNLAGEKALKDLVYLSMTNISQEISFNSLKKTLNLGSSTTVKEYFGYLENSFLVFLVPKFDYSLKKQIHSTKKVYVIDNGLASYLGFRISSDMGRLLENMVFLELKRRKKEIYYHSGKNECDFILREGIKIMQSIQVCYELNRQDRDRETKGLIEAMDKFKLKEGIILTYDQNDEIKLARKKIRIIPVWKWLLEDN